MNNSRRSVVLCVALTLTFHALVLGQKRPDHSAVNLCDVVASADEYRGRLLSLEGILFPSDHSLLLYSPACQPKEGFNVTIQAVLPAAWESLPLGKQLRKLLHRGHSAKVDLTGVFETGGPFGPDGDKFRFVIREILSVEKPK